MMEWVRRVGVVVRLARFGDGGGHGDCAGVLCMTQRMFGGSTKCDAWPDCDTYVAITITIADLEQTWRWHSCQVERRI